MSLLKQKKENDRIAAEASAKAKEEAILRELAIHPVVKSGCSRDVREAYFYGIVIAAIANDDKIDSEERVLIDRVANSMLLRTSDVEEVNQLSVNEKLHLLEEIVSGFKGQPELVRFLYAQFAELWLTGEHDLGELNEIKEMLVEWSGVEFPTGRLKDIKAVVSNASTLNSALDDLSVWLGEDLLMRFAVSRYGNVSLRIAESRAEKAEARRREVEARRREAEAREERERVDRVRRNFDSQIESIGEKYKVNGSMPAGWYEDVWVRFRKISPTDIDWAVSVNSIFKALRKIPHCYAKLVGHGEARSRRKLVWKVVCMILVLRYGKWNVSGTVNDLLRSAMSLSTDGYNEKLEGFIQRSFSDVVTFS